MRRRTQSTMPFSTLSFFPPISANITSYASRRLLIFPAKVCACTSCI